MTDIARCTDERCPIGKQCARFMARTTDRAVYRDFGRHKQKRCSFYIEWQGVVDGPVCFCVGERSLVYCDDSLELRDQRGHRLALFEGRELAQWLEAARSILAMRGE